MRETKEANGKVIASCKGCFFAHKIGITQVGCELNKIQSFRDAGAQIVEAEDEAEEFFIIDRFCSTYRTKDWADSVEDTKAQILLETSIPVNFIVLHSTQSTIDDLEVTLKDIQKQDNKPISVSIVVQDKDIEDGFGLRHRTHEYLDRIDVKFYIVTMLDKECEELEMVDEAFNKCVNGYYSVFRSGSNIPQNFIMKINEAVNIDLEPLSMIRPKDDINGLTVQCVVHKFLNGNYKIPVQKKIELFAEETDRLSFIKPWDAYYE
tara:strand:+ start:13004 stop:13795 length:792 start_codon:yes stop_codon:yes gene_type:complete